MNCPNCGQKEQARVKVCPSCGQAYASEDLQALRQLEFLLAETESWEGVEGLRLPYQERLQQLKGRLVRVDRPKEPPVSKPDRIDALPTTPAAAPAGRIAKKKPITKTAPAPKVPFDEWLLSERNIKFALYGGGILLFVAGIIFVGVNWARIPGPAKFAITLMITGLAFLSGYLLFQRMAYRLGGTALLGLACGFLTLNFAVLQIYVMGPEGFRSDVMWLIASPICLVIYFLIGYWTRQELFGYISIAALTSLCAATLVVTTAPVMVIVLVFALFALLLMLMALLVKESAVTDFTYRPLLFTAQGTMPLSILFSLLIWVDYEDCTRCTEGNPWVLILSLLVSMIFYAVINQTLKWRWARWAAVFLLSLTTVLALIQSGVDDTVAGLLLLLLALAELGAGYFVKEREGQLAGALPFHVMAGALALLVTGMAFLGDTDSLIKVLFADAVLLGVVAWIFQDYRWVYGAVWLTILPVYLLINLYVEAYAYQGLLMGLLGLNYVVAGYVLGRRERHLGWPFLTAAAFLSLVVTILSWPEPLIFALSTAVIAIIYGLIALWLEWPWLLLPALLAIDLTILGVNRVAYSLETPIEPALVISYTFSGGVLLLLGLAFRRTKQKAWAWPFYIVGTIDLMLAYVAGLVVGKWLAVGVSAVLAVLLLTYAWLERDLFKQMKLPPLLTYIGAGVVFGGFIYLLFALGGSTALRFWPAYLAGLCALYMLLAWMLRRDPVGPVYGAPLRHASLVLTIIPLLGALISFDAVLCAVTFAVAALIYAADAVVRRLLAMVYLAAGAFVIVIWSILFAFDVSELLAYVAPLGFGLLAIGWSERREEHLLTYMAPTMLGLAAIMGTTFAESIIYPDRYYAWLLLLESLLAIVWGAIWHVRCYIQAAGLALFANAIVQLGPGFLELSRWVQIAVTGGFLLGTGLLALFKREEILAARQKVAGGWRAFGP